MKAMTLLCGIFSLFAFSACLGQQPSASTSQSLSEESGQSVALNASQSLDSDPMNRFTSLECRPAKYSSSADVYFHAVFSRNAETPSEWNATIQWKYGTGQGTEVYSDLKLCRDAHGGNLIPFLSDDCKERVESDKPGVVLTLWTLFPGAEKYDEDLEFLPKSSPNVSYMLGAICDKH